MSRTLQSVLLSLLLLIAQHGALTHGFMHLTPVAHALVDGCDDDGHGHGRHDDHDDGRGASTALCDFHAVLGEILGGADNASPPELVPVQHAVRVLTASAGFNPASLLAPASRGPPALL